MILRNIAPYLLLLPTTSSFLVAPQRKHATTALFGEYEDYMAARRAQEAKQQEGQPPFPDLSAYAANNPIQSENAPPEDNTMPPIENYNDPNLAVPPPPEEEVPVVPPPPKKKDFSPGGGSAWWKTSGSKKPDDDETARLKKIMMEARQRVQQTRQQRSDTTKDAWWKQEASPMEFQQETSLDPPSSTGEPPVIENERLLEKETSSWKASDAQDASSWGPPITNSGEPPVIENEQLTETQAASTWWKASDALEGSSLDPPTNAGEPPVIENEQLTETQAPSTWWKASDAMEASSLDPPTNAGEPPVIENERLMDLNIDESPVMKEGKSPTAPKTEPESSSWWKASDPQQPSLDPPNNSAGEAPVVESERLDMPKESMEMQQMWWKPSEPAEAEPSLESTQQTGEAPVLKEDLPVEEPVASQDDESTPWWKVPKLLNKDDEDVKDAVPPVAANSPPKQEQTVEEPVAAKPPPQQEQKVVAKKAPWWKGAQKKPETKTAVKSSKLPLTMRYSSDAATVSEHILKSCPSETQASGAGGSSTWDAFQRVEENWRRLRFGLDEAPRNFVTNDAAVGSCSPACWERLRKLNSRAKPLDYDILVCGGTLGIFFATALAMKGHRVGVLEAGKLQGRAQEWNISQNELDELVELGILSKEDIEAAVKTDFPACRSGFKNEEESPLGGGYFSNGIGYECITPDVLNLGVSPSSLLERVKKRFEKLGGVVYETTRLQGIALSSAVGVALDVGEDQDPITAQLVLDCMGNASPISKQQRQGKKPDGVCAVVGSCAAGFDASSNTLGDIIYTFNPIQEKGGNGKLQYFWEAFPVGIGRNGLEPGTSDVKTTYMFTYMDADEQRPSMLSLMEDYWKLLPTYQPSIQNPATDLDVKRVLFAYFPTYTDSPLKPQWDRILAVGDASGIQSPLSFGGFGALTRHIGRITTAIDEAMENKLLDKESLGAINAYTPNLSAAWMFQKAMSVRMGQNVDEKFVNRLLAVNFEVMDQMGMRTIKPFLQDVIRFDGLVGSLARSFIADPTYMPTIVGHVGIPRLVDWLGHVTMMGTYDLLHKAATPILRPVVNNALQDPAQKYRWRRRMESWKFGSGNDYILPDDDESNGGSDDRNNFYDDQEEREAESTTTFAPFS